MDRSELLKLAHLARLNIDTEALDEVGDRISNVLTLVDQLKAADTADVEPLAHPLDAITKLRPDEVTETDQRDVFMAIAPATEDGLYLVPKVID